jgi:2-polyprenyl-3-methyl-5-hydroxy-6-metoxy-1,4-benzoquinol methylase
VVCCEVLEHAPLAGDIVRQAQRWLVRGGVFIVTCATHPRRPHSAVSGEHIEIWEEYYMNVASELFVSWASCFKRREISINEAHGDLYAVCVR